MTSWPVLPTLYREDGTVHSSPPSLLSSSERDEMVRKSTLMRSWRMGSREIADLLPPLLCTKTTFHSLGKIHPGPSGRNGLPQDSCLLSSRLGGQGWLTQMPPFLSHPDLKLASGGVSVCVRDSRREGPWNFPAAIFIATGAAVSPRCCFDAGTFRLSRKPNI